MEWTYLTEKTPIKGKDIIAEDKYGKEHYVFLSPIGNEWRCSLTGYGLIIGVVRWRYTAGDKEDE